jgi:sec-independent protein translocase protein TatC
MSEDKDMSFLEHLEELRFRLMRSAIAIFAGAVTLFFLKDFVFDDVIFAPRKLDFITYRWWCSLGQWLGMADELCIKEISYEIISTTMVGQFTAHLMVSFIGGIVIAFPYLFWEIWSFIKPGLREKEKKTVRGITFFVSMLFFMGVLFGYYIITPLSLQFLGSYQVGDVASRIAIGSYMKTVVSTTLATGLVFQLPIVVYFLSKIGLISSTFLKKYRKHAIVVVLIVAAIITPPDLMSQILVSIPLLILYEVSIVIAKRVEKSRPQ